MRKPLKKILIACDSPKSLFDVTGKLVKRMTEKHKVYVFIPKITQQHIRDKLIALNVIIYEVELDGGSISFYSDIKYCWRLYQTLKKVRPDVFFPSTLKPVIYGTLLSKHLKINLVTPMLSGLGYNFSKAGSSRLVSKVVRLLLKAGLSESKHLRIILQNKDDHQTLLKSGVLTIKHAVFVVNGPGVDLGHFLYCRPEVDTVSFMMAARLINAKGISEYFEAARIIKQRYPEMQFKLIGSYSPNIDAIPISLLKEIKGSNIVTYLGDVEDVRPHIKDSSVVVLPSYYGEGIPRSLLEGMAMGRAIITCDSVGCRETVEKGPKLNGTLIAIANVPELVAAMEFYLDHKSSILDHGINGYELALKKFDIDLVNAQMLDVMKLA
jgi:glycosyltransferase involved in cell wall biosynthesis